MELGWKSGGVVNMGNDGRGERGRWTEAGREQKMPLCKNGLNRARTELK